MKIIKLINKEFNKSNLKISLFLRQKAILHSENNILFKTKDHYNGEYFKNIFILNFKKLFKIIYTN
jgi:hypothetical protein